jgi:hypothetical protein
MAQDYAQRTTEWFSNYDNLIHELDLLGTCVKKGFIAVEGERKRVENLMKHVNRLAFEDGGLAKGRIKTFFIEYMYVIHDEKNRMIREYPVDEFPEKQQEIEELKRRMNALKEFNAGLSESAQKLVRERDP